jgi:CubicO group peptidase (beta-lactamase class C family)
MLDWEAATRRLAAQRPLWPPGSGYAYHAITHGWLAGEVIRRVAGMSVGEAFARLVTGPLNAAAWIGRPGPNVAHLQVSPGLAALWDADRARDTPEAPFWPYRSMTLGQALPGALVRGEEGFNDPRVQAAEIPGAGGIATASALAEIWSATVADTAGVRLLQPATIAAATAVQTEGAPVFYLPPPYPRWGMGFQLDSEARRFLTPGSFGHDGAGGQVGFADPAYRLGFAFVTNWLEGADDLRATGIIDALRTVLHT